jgi:shikimate dehydrogenase
MSTPDGATRLHFVLGDPIAQVKSPAGVSRSFARRGANALVLPAQVASEDLECVMVALGALRNLDGLTITVPHKFAAFRHCATVTDRARLLGAVNVMRRNADRAWHGDMLDGEAMLGAIRAHGFDPRGRAALLVGAGGAGTAIALSLLEAGVASLAVHDVDAARVEALVGRLGTGAAGRLRAAASADPAGCDLVVNATPSGMRPGDPLPVRAERLTGQVFVADVITAPEVTPLLAEARRLGSRNSTGADMFEAQVELIAEFLLCGA